MGITDTVHSKNAWWRHQMETFSVLLALCAVNSPVTGEFPTQRPMTRNFDVLFDLRLNKRLRKQSGRWFETPSRSLWRHSNVYSRLLLFLWWSAARFYPYHSRALHWHWQYGQLIHPLGTHSVIPTVFQLPHCRWSNPEEYGLYDHLNLLETKDITIMNQNTTKQCINSNARVCLAQQWYW